MLTLYSQQPRPLLPPCHRHHDGFHRDKLWWYSVNVSSSLSSSSSFLHTFCLRHVAPWHQGQLETATEPARIHCHYLLLGLRRGSCGLNSRNINIISAAPRETGSERFVSGGDDGIGISASNEGPQPPTQHPRTPRFKAFNGSKLPSTSKNAWHPGACSHCPGLLVLDSLFWHHPRAEITVHCPIVHEPRFPIHEP